MWRMGTLPFFLRPLLITVAEGYFSWCKAAETWSWQHTYVRNEQVFTSTPPLHIRGVLLKQFNFTCPLEIWGPDGAVKRGRGSSVGIMTDYGLDDRGSIPRQKQSIFLLVSASRPAPGPTQPPIQWVPGLPSPGVKRGRGVTLTTHPYLVPRLSMSRSYTSSPPMCISDV
jgi:hypothetical protein